MDIIIESAAARLHLVTGCPVRRQVPWHGCIGWRKDW